jgi:hypothetical protein
MDSLSALAALGKLPLLLFSSLKKHSFSICLLLLLALKILADCHTNDIMGDSHNLADYSSSLS